LGQVGLTQGLSVRPLGGRSKARRARPPDRADGLDHEVVQQEMRTAAARRGRQQPLEIGSLQETADHR
jgi:hypothetical protein